MKIIILNGPNLNLLTSRDKTKYGKFGLSQINKLLKIEFPEVAFTFYQSNLEGELVNYIQSADKNFNGLIINPGGYAHTSVAILDALELCKIPKVEVHLSHISRREEFRKNLLTARNCDGYISGFKEKGYLAAVYLIMKLWECN